MSTVTLEAVKTKQTELAAMIAALEANAKRLVVFPCAEIQLNEGEHYAGIITGKDGEPGHHLILLPEEIEKSGWDIAIKWAKNGIGQLPTRREQALLYANLKGQFQPSWYWSCEQHASHSDYVWVQHLNVGHQYVSLKSAEWLARAVRRLPID